MSDAPPPSPQPSRPHNRCFLMVLVLFVLLMLLVGCFMWVMGRVAAGLTIIYPA